MEMRTAAEVDNALRHMEAAINSEAAQQAGAGDPSLVAAAAVVGALRWVRGIDEPGGFGAMLAALDDIDRAEAGDVVEVVQ